MTTSHWRWSLLGASVGAILLLTLVPGEPGVACSIYEFDCGQRSLADALLNIILFVPLGLALGSYRWKILTTCFFALALSGLVELTQVILPGRYASTTDLAANVLGAAAGVWLVHSSSRWLYPVPAKANRLAVASVALAIGSWALTGYLLRPAYPSGIYLSEWTPYQLYHGQVLRASLGSVPLRHFGHLDSQNVRASIAEGQPISVEIVAGPSNSLDAAPIEMAPFLMLWDEVGRALVALGVDNDDLVFSYPTVADAIGLDSPDLRVSGAFHDVSYGDTVEVMARRDVPGYALEVGKTVSRVTGYTIGLGWSLLMYEGRLPPWSKNVLNLLWLAATALPLGYWARGSWFSVAAILVCLAAAAFLPRVLELMPTTPLEYAGLFAGLGAGYSLQVLVRRKAAPALDP